MDGLTPEALDDLVTFLWIDLVVVVVEGLKQLTEGVDTLADNVFIEGVEEVAFAEVFLIVIEIENHVFLFHEDVVVKHGGIVGDKGVGVRQDGVYVQMAGEEKDMGVGLHGLLNHHVGMGFEDEEFVVPLQHFV